MAKLVDAQASGACGVQTLCRFESGSRHHTAPPGHGLRNKIKVTTGMASYYPLTDLILFSKTC